MINFPVFIVSKITHDDILAASPTHTQPVFASSKIKIIFFRFMSPATMMMMIMIKMTTINYIDRKDLSLKFHLADMQDKCGCVGRKDVGKMCLVHEKVRCVLVSFSRFFVHNLYK